MSAHAYLPYDYYILTKTVLQKTSCCLASPSPHNSHPGILYLDSNSSNSICNDIQQLSLLRTDTGPHGSWLDKSSLLTSLHSIVPNSEVPAWNGLVTSRESQYSKCHLPWITHLDMPQNTPNITFLNLLDWITDEKWIVAGAKRDHTLF